MLKEFKHNMQLSARRRRDLCHLFNGQLKDTIVIPLHSAPFLLFRRRCAACGRMERCVTECEWRRKTYIIVHCVILSHISNAVFEVPQRQKRLCAPGLSRQVLGGIHNNYLK